MRDETVTALRGFDSYEVRLGDELRGERACKGKSLLDVQRELKIKAAYIDAIENCDATVFPNPGYIAGYVRAYARYLGRDADDIYARFCAESGFQSINSMLADPRRARDARSRSPRAAAPHCLQDEMLRSARHLPKRREGLSMAALSGLGSVMVLAAVVGGLGYGGWYLLREVQRIGFAPLAQTPEVIGLPDAPAILTAEAAPSLPQGLQGQDVALHDLYAPRMDAPRVEPRDGPIVAIDPDSYGIFAPGPRTPAVPPLITAEGVPASAEEASSAGATDEPTPVQGPPAPPVVSITVTDNAWVRVFLANNTIVFERILKPGEAWEVPADLSEPLLRAGNAGAVYLRVGDILYGPLGKGASVVKRVPLDANSIAASWPVAKPAVLTPAVERSASLPASD